MGQRASRQLPKTVGSTLTVRPAKPSLSHTPPRIKTSETVNSNAGLMGQVKVTEIPIKLDENNPAMKLLRNRAALESSTDDDGNSVRPGTFVSIVEDLQHYTAVEVQKRYSLSDEFMEALRVVNMSVAKERIKEEKEDTEEKDVSSEEEQILNRSNVKSDLESALDQLMRPKS